MKPPPAHPNCRSEVVRVPGDTVECIGGPWDGERVRPPASGMIAIVRATEPVGFIAWTPTGPEVEMAEPAIVGVYRLIRGKAVAIVASLGRRKMPPIPPDFMRWEPLE